jgi:hypothetical protein
MAPKYHPAPLTGGDRKALTKELRKSRAMTQSVEMQNLLCQSWNERVWRDGEPIDPVADPRPGCQRRLSLVEIQHARYNGKTWMCRAVNNDGRHGSWTYHLCFGAAELKHVVDTTESISGPLFAASH